MGRFGTDTRGKRRHRIGNLSAPAPLIRAAREMLCDVIASNRR